MPAPVNPAIAAHDRAHGINADQSADDYYIVWRDPHALKDIAGTTREVSEALAAVKVDRVLGVAIADHLRDLGLQMQKLDPEAKRQWVAQQKTLAMQSAGSKEAAAAIEKDAREFMKQSGVPFWQQVDTYAASNSWWFLSTMANHARNYTAWQKGRPT